MTWDLGESGFNWISLCIRSVRFSVLVNGMPIFFFRRSYLSFPIHLSNGMFKQNAHHCLYKWLGEGIQGSQTEYSLEVFHFLYADDFLVLCDAEEEHTNH